MGDNATHRALAVNGANLGLGHSAKFAPKFVQKVRTDGGINSLTRLAVEIRAEQDHSRRKEEQRGQCIEIPSARCRNPIAVARIGVERYLYSDSACIES